MRFHVPVEEELKAGVWEFGAYLGRRERSQKVIPFPFPPPTLFNNNEATPTSDRFERPASRAALRKANASHSLHKAGVRCQRLYFLEMIAGLILIVSEQHLMQNGTKHTGKPTVP
jgi:hypothetical protein